MKLRKEFMNTGSKTIGLMLASDNCEGVRCYHHMVKACEDTWINNSEYKSNIYKVYGRGHNPSLASSIEVNKATLTNNNEIIVNTIESRANLLRKTISAMEFCLNTISDIDYFFRPNCGSYINMSLFNEFLYDKPKVRYYSGINGMYNGIKYASGSCFIISRDVAEFIVHNSSDLEDNGNIFMDDVSIGKFLLDNNIDLQNDAKRIDCKSKKDLADLFDINCYHYYFQHTIDPELIYLCHRMFHSNIL